MKRFRLQLILVCGVVLVLSTANVALGVRVLPGILPPNDPSNVPSNDDCDQAKIVFNVDGLLFDTTHATFDGPGHYIKGPNIWYCYTATCTGCATVSLRGSEFDTKIAVYNGCDCYPELKDLIIKNDDFHGQQSQVTFPVIKNHQYLIEVGGFNPSVTGQGTMKISCDPHSTQPDNDDCINARRVRNVTDLPFTTICATFDGPGHYFTSPNVWYKYTAQNTGEVTVSLLGSEYDTALSVYGTGDCYPKSEDIIDQNDDFGGTLQSQITFQAIAGYQYLFEVQGYDADEVGDGVLTVSSEGEPPASNNDECHNAKPIAEITDLPFDTIGATRDGPQHCMYSSNLWYCYTASCTGEVVVDLAGSSFDTMLAVYEGCDCETAWENMIECNDDADNSYQSKIIFDAVAGNQYLIEVGGYGLEAGQGILNVSCDGAQPPPSSNDKCEDAQSIDDVKNLPFDTTDAAFDGPGLCMTSPNIWYCYTASCTGDVTVSLAGSSYDTMLAVYDGCKCYPTADDLIECNDDAEGGYHSVVTFAAIAGNQYLIEVGGYATETGEGLLNISCEGGAVPNKPDLGDAPDSTNNFGNSMTAYPKGVFTGPRAHYPTVYDDGSGTGPYGPVHINAQTVAFLGKKITREIEADTGPDEDGVNNIRPQGNWPDDDDGDDGVVFPINMPSCRFATIDYIVNVLAPNTDLWVNIWLDWNRDGDWDDVVDCPEGPVSEWAVQNQFLSNLPAGGNEITSPGFLAWHPEDGTEEIWMRITLSGQPWRPGSDPQARGNAGSGPEGKYEIGETEDYYFTPDVSIELCQDYNGDGVIDMNDLADIVADWLENCP
ncbi:MAG: GEVED domain-containing protein [Planctomycetota bacterium]